ncbi:hypothetical protein WME99_41070 [Sorangium sp. So ce136]|uniref:hypothetical protein n=1 Tax=Sorangium sp. So ce136 TaxID=3133284 RepID=UPI003F0D1886
MRKLRGKYGVLCGRGQGRSESSSLAAAPPAARAAMGGRGRLLRAVASMAALAAFAAVASCSVTVDLEPLGDGVCPAGEKACYVVDEGEMGCVPIEDPDYGCTVEGCAPCSLFKADAVCAANDPVGRCVMSSCVAEFEDCDGNLFNGCEAHTETDVEHCGGCEERCSCDKGLPVCLRGACACR